MSGTPAYQLGEEIGRGALGRVVRVVDQAGAMWAGKILHASHREDPRALARFQVEARLLGSLAHPNVVHVRELATIDGEPVLVMELVEGPSLAAVIAREAPLPVARIVALGTGIAAGLAAAHRAGLIHRDLKPANVLVAPGDVPKLVDFGLARAASFAGVAAEEFAIVGTPDYMAPEAVTPLAVDARSDLYALGCILCELATGVPPFAGATAFALIDAHRRAPLPPLAGVPRELAQLIRWCLAKAPTDRPQSATAVAEGLARLGRGETALVAAGARAVTEALACPTCGATGVADVAVCFACGSAHLRLEAGGYTLFVVGPGELAHKLDTRLRNRLLARLRGATSLGLDVRHLQKRVPRLPFPVVIRVSEASAHALAAVIEPLGLRCEVHRGGPLALPAMRRKAWKLTGRVALIAVTSTAGVWSHLGAGGAPAVVALAAIPLVAGVRIARAPATKRRAAPRRALPAGLTAALDRVAGVVPAIEAPRHRDSLRGVIDRALALRAAVHATRAPAMDDELTELIDAATVASARIDELERAIAAADLRDPDAATRAAMSERDRCAARLLELTAFLDALRLRLAVLATGAAGDADAETALADLRAHVEALEEVRAL